MDRVKWFRAHAERDRAREEVEILQEEFKRTILSFQKMSSIWEQLAKSYDDGRAAYSYQQSATFKRLAANCIDSHTTVVGSLDHE